jgi:hypothetical protein
MMRVVHSKHSTTTPSSIAYEAGTHRPRGVIVHKQNVVNWAGILIGLLDLVGLNVRGRVVGLRSGYTWPIHPTSR